jgi:dihydrofolate reductase
MSKLLYGAAMSLDGFIAGAGGDMQWLNQHSGPNPIVGELIATVGALLIGKRTFTGDDPNRGTEKEGAFGGAWSGPQFVLTHHAPDEPEPGVTYLGDLGSAVAAAKAAAGDKYVSIFGADVARQCLEAGLVDEILVTIVPVLLGDGVRLFDCPGGTNVKLERPRQSEAANATNLWFRVAK